MSEHTSTATTLLITARADAHVVVPVIRDEMKASGFNVTSRDSETPVQLRRGSLLTHFFTHTLVELVSGGGGDGGYDPIVYAQIRIVDERNGRTTIALEHLHAPATGIADNDPVWASTSAAVMAALEANGIGAERVPH